MMTRGIVPLGPFVSVTDMYSAVIVVIGMCICTIDSFLYRINKL